MATNKLAERIERTRLKLEALNKIKKEEDSKASGAKRTRENRLKIIAGAWFLKQATPEEKQKMIEGLAAKDRELFK